MSKDKIYETIERIRSKFKTEIEDEHENDLSFVDEVNDLVRNIFEDEPIDIYTALSQESLDRWKKRKWRRVLRRWTSKIDLQKVFYFTLLTTIVGFLVSQALTFYMVDGVISTETYIKAILTEVCFIFLNGYRSSNNLQMWAVNALRVSIFCLMLFVISYGAISSGVRTVGQIDGISTQIEFIEEQIKQKDELIEFYRERGWGVNVRVQTDEKNKLVDRLLELREQQTEGLTESMSDLTVYQTYGAAIFRVILLLTSVLITRRLFKF